MQADWPRLAGSFRLLVPVPLPLFAGGGITPAASSSSSSEAAEARLEEDEEEDHDGDGDLPSEDHLRRERETLGLPANEQRHLQEQAVARHPAAPDAQQRHLQPLPHGHGRGSGGGGAGTSGGRSGSGGGQVVRSLMLRENSRVECDGGWPTTLSPFNFSHVLLARGRHITLAITLFLSVGLSVSSFIIIIDSSFPSFRNLAVP